VHQAVAACAAAAQAARLSSFGYGAAMTLWFGANISSMPCAGMLLVDQADCLRCSLLAVLVCSPCHCCASCGE
jgi:hypothetical protein